MTRPFAGGLKGAGTSAPLYGLFESANANGLDPWATLNYLLQSLGTPKSPDAVAAVPYQDLPMDDVRPDRPTPRLLGP